jgi:hypothetical protein
MLMRTAKTTVEFDDGDDVISEDYVVAAENDFDAQEVLRRHLGQKITIGRLHRVSEREEQQLAMRSGELKRYSL